MTFFPYSDTKSHFFEKLTFPTLRQGSSLVVARPTSMKIRPGGSRRTEWHVAIDILGQKKVIFEILTMRRNSFFLRNLHLLRSDRGRVWLWRDRQAWKFVRQARGKSSSEWHVAIDILGQKKVIFEILTMRRNSFFFEKFTFATLRQGSSLVVARPTSMEICPGGPGEVVVQNDMSRLTFSGKKRSFLRFWQCVEIHFFWEIYICYAQTGVEFGCGATDKHGNLSGRPGGSRRTEWHVAIDILGQKKVRDSDNASKFIFFWEIYICYAQTGVEFGCGATDKHGNLSGRPGGSRRTEWHVAIDILGQKKVIFEILTMRRNSFFWEIYIYAQTGVEFGCGATDKHGNLSESFLRLRNLHLLTSMAVIFEILTMRRNSFLLRNLHLLRSDRTRPGGSLSGDSDNASKFIFFWGPARGKSSYRMTCRDWHSRAKKGHFWDSDNASKFIFFEKFTFATLRQGSSLVVARPTSMEICPGGPGEVVVQNDMSRLTFSGKKRSFLRFWQCVEIHFFEKFTNDYFSCENGEKRSFWTNFFYH